MTSQEETDPVECDVCGKAKASQWCEPCSALLCQEESCVAQHEGEGHSIAPLPSEEGDDVEVTQFVSLEEVHGLMTGTASKVTAATSTATGTAIVNRPTSDGSS